MIKDQLGQTILKEYVALGPKKYSYLRGDDFVDKKTKGTKKCVIKWEIKSEDH